jgi:hypothetical protein
MLPLMERSPVEAAEEYAVKALQIALLARLKGGQHEGSK